MKKDLSLCSYEQVEQLIIEQNMLDVFAMIENYCKLLRERAEVLENNK